MSHIKNKFIDIIVERFLKIKKAHQILYMRVQYPVDTQRKNIPQPLLPNISLMFSYLKFNKNIFTLHETC